MLGKMNRKLILDSLRKAGPQSRAELSRTLGMSFPTVSGNVEELIGLGLIVPLVKKNQDGDAAPGRKPSMLSYNAEWAYVVSVDLGRSHIRMMVSNVAGASLKTCYFKLVGTDEAELIRQIDAQFARLLAELEIPIEKVYGVSIGIPGCVDRATGQLKMAPFLNEGLRNYRLDKFFEEKYGLRVYTQNSVNLACIAEKWQGAGVEYSDIVYVDCAVGLGSALILGGELMSGHNGAAGEIGYMLPGIHFRRQQFEEGGVLEKILGASEFEKYMARQADVPAVPDTPEGRQWLQYLDDTKNYLAQALVNLTAVVNPEIIIIGGRFGRIFMQYHQGYFEEFLRAHVPFVPVLANSMLGENAALIGASAYALRYVHADQALL